MPNQQNESGKCATEHYVHKYIQDVASELMSKISNLSKRLTDHEIDHHHEPNDCVKHWEETSNIRIEYSIPEDETLSDFVHRLVSERDKIQQQYDNMVDTNNNALKFQIQNAVDTLRVIGRFIDGMTKPDEQVQASVHAATFGMEVALEEQLRNVRGRQV